jgi:hypothetical protein
MSGYKGQTISRVSETPTQFAVLCPNHDQVFLTYAEYMSQMMRPDSTWRCPLCMFEADWDDDNYESHIAANE